LPKYGEGLEYISPECIEDLEYSPAMDLWALGCVIFEMLTGEAAFTGADSNELI